MGNSDRKEFPLYYELRKEATIISAWRKVRSNGVKSKSPEIRSEVIEFESDLYRHIRRLTSQLRDCRFQFQPSMGICIHQAGKKPRPIVIPPVMSRLVQRAILDVLQKQSKIQEVANIPTSFGGLPNKNVPDAIKFLLEQACAGNKYYIKSDIKGFFASVAKLDIQAKLGQMIDDTKFLKIAADAMQVELDDVSRQRNSGAIFPTEEIGIAQGSCLSPLFANIVLKEFDDKLNDRGVVCIRYIHCCPKRFSLSSVMG